METTMTKRDDFKAGELHALNNVRAALFTRTLHDARDIQAIRESLSGIDSPALDSLDALEVRARDFANSM